MTAVDGNDTHYQYLESLDSVRTPFRASPGDPETGEMALLQIFSEVLMSVVLDRTVVVPQSFAFDSWGFHQVAATFLTARDAAGAAGVHPFALHTHGPGIGGFDDAVAGFLTRVDDPDRPFASSAFPELGEHPVEEASARWLLGQDWLGDERATAFETVHREFSRLDPVRPRPHAGVTGLRELVAAYGSAAPRHIAAGSDRELAVHERLVRSVRALDWPHQPRTDLRSSLRSREPWPGDPAGRTTADVLGGQEPLDELTEFVDTLYNAVVAGSFGRATTTFSTGLATEDDRLAARRIAQRLAIAQWNPGPGGAGRDPLNAPMFEVRETGRSTAVSKRTVRRRMRLVYETAEDSLPALFDELADRRSRFRAGLGRLRKAQRDGDPKEIRKALLSHVEYADRLLGGGIEVRARDHGAIAIGIGSAVAAGEVLVNTTWALPPGLQGVIAGVGAGLAAVSGPLAAAPAALAGHRRAAAMLEVLGPGR